MRWVLALNLALKRRSCNALTMPVHRPHSGAHPLVTFGMYKYNNTFGMYLEGMQRAARALTR
jgi:hypothetical protein